MPPKKKKQTKKLDPKVETTMKKLESMDMEDFHSGSAANVKVEDTLVPTIFDWIPEGLDKEAEWVLGIDEAGRGPVLGPMVYSAAISRLERHQEVREELGANDSKQLKEIERERMLKSIDKSGWVAYTGEVLTPAHLSSCMLRQVKYNLNTLSHDTARAMIDRMLNHFKFNIAEIYVDTVGKPEFYQEKLQNWFPRISITVASKADSTYPIVGAASIVAKVARDMLVHNWPHLEPGIDSELETGSGYPGDPKTKSWLRSNTNHVFGLPSFARISWETSKKVIRENCLNVKWEDHLALEEEEAKQGKQGKIGSKRTAEDAEPVVKRKKRAAAMYSDYKLARTDLTTFLKAF